MLVRKSLAPSPGKPSRVLTRGTDGHLTSGVSASKLRLDPVHPTDDLFQYQTYASTRTEEMALTGWTREQQDTFLRMQYEAQRRSYLLQLPNAEYSVIRRDETAVGRLILDRTSKEIHLVDIALLPEFRAQGIGSALMEAILKEATQAHKSVRLHVESFNPALRWYERLGFSVLNTGPIYLEMVWRPPQLSGSRSRPASGSEQVTQEPTFGAAYVDLFD